MLKNLTFLPGRHIISPQARPELERLLNYLVEHPTLHIEIQGHICCENNADGLDLDTGDRHLSVTRAKYVYDYLVTNGIEANRLHYAGYARTRPLVKLERTDEDREKNRRVEIKIVKK